MKIIFSAAICCLLARAASRAEAEPFNVSFGGDLWNPPEAPSLGGKLRISFAVDSLWLSQETPEAVRPPGPLTVRLTSDLPLVMEDGSGLVSWLNYVEDNYYAIHVRMANVLQPGDEFQILMASSTPFYSKVSNIPFLNEASLSGLGGMAYYIRPERQISYVLISNGDYKVVAVPEPSSLALAGFATALVGGWARRRMKGPVKAAL